MTLRWKQKPTSLRSVVVAGLIMMFTGCGKTSATSPALAPTWVADATTPFGFALLQQAWSGKQNGNVVISPVSVAMALTMTANGAGGATRDAILDTLHLAGRTMDEINLDFRAAQEAVVTPGRSVQLALANSLWLQEGNLLQDTFLDNTQRFFDAHCSTLDLHGAGAEDRINAWVQRATRNGVRRLVSGAIDRDTVLLLVNALYFKSPWQLRFDPMRTAPGDFLTIDGRRVSVPMMTQKGQFRMGTSDTFESLALPFVDGRFEMVFMLPKGQVSMSRAVEALTRGAWSQVLLGLRETPLTIRIPRFTLEWTADLTQALAALGMGVAFSDQADFSNLLKNRPRGPVLVDEVRHGVFLEVNENGARAAAATAVDIHARGSSPAARVFEVNQPFVCAVRDTASGLLLVVGVIGDPSVTAPQ